MITIEFYTLPIFAGGSSIKAASPSQNRLPGSVASGNEGIPLCILFRFEKHAHDKRAYFFVLKNRYMIKVHTFLF